MKVFSWVFVAALCSECFFLSRPALAHHPAAAFGQETSGPITTIGGTPLSQGTIAAGIRVEGVAADPYSDAQLLSLAGAGSEVHSLDYLLVPFLNLAYGATGDLTLNLQFPFYSVRGNIREGHDVPPPEVHEHGTSGGVGDLTLFGQYRFLHEDSGGLDAALLAGIKFPTGMTKVRARDGGRLETEMQPGSGSFDPLAGAAATRHFGKFCVDASGLYGFVTEGAQHTDLGDFFLYGAAGAYRLQADPVPLDLVLEINGEWRQKHAVGAAKDADSGGHSIYLSPGVRVGLGGNWLLAVAAGIPVLQDLNGIQQKTRVRGTFQISTTWDP